MTPVKFPQQTTVWARDQPPYHPLPAYTDNQQTISCWRLTYKERLSVLIFGKLWLRQMNFGKPLQPQELMIKNPFVL